MINWKCFTSTITLPNERLYKSGVPAVRFDTIKKRIGCTSSECQKCFPLNWFCSAFLLQVSPRHTESPAKLIWDLLKRCAFYKITRKTIDAHLVTVKMAMLMWVSFDRCIKVTLNNIFIQNCCRKKLNVPELIGWENIRKKNRKQRNPPSVN